MILRKVSKFACCVANLAPFYPTSDNIYLNKLKCSYSVEHFDLVACSENA